MKVGAPLLLTLPLATAWLASPPRCFPAAGAAASAGAGLAGAHALQRRALLPRARSGLAAVRCRADADEPRGDGGEKQGTSIDKGVFGGGSGGQALLEDTDFSVNTILKQLESIQQGTPKNIVILGTRHCSFLHQQARPPPQPKPTPARRPPPPDGRSSSCSRTRSSCPTTTFTPRAPPAPTRPQSEGHCAPRTRIC